MATIEKIKQQFKKVAQGLDEIIEHPEKFSKEDIKSVRQKLSAALDEIEAAFAAKLEADKKAKASR